MIIEKLNLPPPSDEMKNLALSVLEQQGNKVHSHNGKMLVHSGVTTPGTKSHQLFIKNTNGRELISAGFVEYCEDLVRLKTYYQSLIDIPFPNHFHLQACYVDEFGITGPADCGPAHRFTTGPSIIIPITNNITIRTFADRPTHQIDFDDMWQIPKGHKIDSFNGMYDRSLMIPDKDIILEENVAYLINWKDAILEEIRTSDSPSYKMIFGILQSDSLTAEQVNSWIKI